MTAPAADVARLRKRLKTGLLLAGVGFVLVTGGASSGHLWILPLGVLFGLAGSFLTTWTAVAARRLAKRSEQG